MSSRKILIIDDDHGVTDTFSRMLRLEGYEVQTASDPEAGLRECARSRPDAIIVDLRMPLIDGLGFLRLLREREEHKTTPVAIVTGDYFLEDAEGSEVRSLGAQVLFSARTR